MSSLSSQSNPSHRSGAASQYHTANFARASIDKIHRRKKAPSMSDVAELADVSLQTVSHVLNGETSVSDKTRTEVLAAIDALGYRRNNAAVSLVTNRSHIIGIIDGAAAHSAPYNTIRAIQEAAYNVQYTVCLAHIGVKSNIN